MKPIEETHPTTTKEWNAMFERGEYSKPIQASKRLAPIIQRTTIDKAKLKEAIEKVLEHTNFPLIFDEEVFKIRLFKELELE